MSISDDKSALYLIQNRVRNDDWSVRERICTLYIYYIYIAQISYRMVGYSVDIGNRHIDLLTPIRDFTTDSII